MLHQTGVGPSSLAHLLGEPAMSLSPKHSIHSHSTPFSVTDILSPLEESYRISKSLVDHHNHQLSQLATTESVSGAPTPPSPYHNLHHLQTPSAEHLSSGSQSPVSAVVAAMNSSSPYMHVPQLPHPGASAFPQYCNGDLHGMSGHYGGDIRNSTAAGWYGTSPTDPFSRSKLNFMHRALSLFYYFVASLFPYTTNNSTSILLTSQSSFLVVAYLFNLL